MRRRVLSLLAIVALGAQGCGARSSLAPGRSAAEDAGVTISDGGTGGAASDGGSGGSPGDPWAAKLSGYWMQQSIGDCINGEEWYGLTPPSGFVHTVVDRNFCGPHGVRVDPGSASLDAGHAVTLAWTTPLGHEQRHFTAQVLDPFPSPPPVPDPGYVPGTRALDVMAYRRLAGTLVWHRETTRASDWSGPPSGSSATTLKIDVTLDAPPVASSAPVACTMTVAVQASVSPASGPLPSAGAESWAFPCHRAQKPGSTWIHITADGFEQSDVDSSWLDFLQAKGVEGKYAGGVVGLFEEGFRPILEADPADPDGLFHDVAFAWFHEMKSPPPDKVP